MRDVVAIAIGCAIVALLAAIAYQNHRRFHVPLLTTPYQAVMLTNGSLLYGRIDHLGTDHPVLRDVFVVREEPHAAPGERYRLVRRRNEANGADHVIFPASSIAYVEPVQRDSIVGRLIEKEGLGR
jgi:hypothetical protein